VDAIAERLRRLRACSDEELRGVSAAGREIIETSFSLSSEAGALREIYERAVHDQEHATAS
jgi:glycosyltransferase involved in cell wall biosynthesis